MASYVVVCCANIAALEGPIESERLIRPYVFPIAIPAMAHVESCDHGGLPRCHQGVVRPVYTAYRSQARGDQGYFRNFASRVRFAIFIFPRTEPSPVERNAERTLSSRQNFGSILGLLHC